MLCGLHSSGPLSASDLAGNPEAVHERVVCRKAKGGGNVWKCSDLASSNVRMPERGTASPRAMFGCNPLI